jgi:hypothetical protein
MKRFFGSLVLEELGKESISIFQPRSPPDGSDVLGFPCGVSFESVEARQEVEGSRGMLKRRQEMTPPSLKLK